jgi:prepilin-type N-terminal cleavage/methylation domain-containing protein
MTTAPVATAPDDRGFTLIEVTISIAIFVVVMTLALGQMTAGITQTRRVDQATQRASAVRLVLDGIVGELRQASTGEASLPVIVSRSSTALTFYSLDRQTPAHLRRISYRLTGRTLERSEIVSTNSGTAPWTMPSTADRFTPVINDVSNTDIFVYLTSTGAIVTSPSQTVSAVTLHIDVPSGLNSSVESIYRTRVDIRSLQ